MAAPRRPSAEPIGLLTARTAKVLSRAFDDALSAAGGSLPSWLVLMSLKGRVPGAQRELAESVGVEGPTLTHHLNRMEAQGLLTRRRDPANRRAHLVELTEAGDAAFAGLRQTVVAFDARLRAGFTDEELAHLRGYLERLQANVATDPPDAARAAGPAGSAGAAPEPEVVA
jgi:MarR family transcriptional regulator for hemolysin